MGRDLPKIVQQTDGQFWPSDLGLTPKPVLHHSVVVPLRVALHVALGSSILCDLGLPSLVLGLPTLVVSDHILWQSGYLPRGWGERLPLPLPRRSQCFGLGTR